MVVSRRQVLCSPPDAEAIFRIVAMRDRLGDPLNSKKRTLLRCCLLLKDEDLLKMFAFFNAHRKPKKERNETYYAKQSYKLLYKTTVQALGLLVSFN